MFLSHDWKTAGNHERIRNLNDTLRGRRVVTWFDEDDMPVGSNITECMSRGIDGSEYFVAFLTRNYIDKVAGPVAKDNCKKEFQYAELTKGAEKMIAVVMEPELLDPSTWNGPVGMNLAGKLYIDFTCDSRVETVASLLCSKTKPPLHRPPRYIPNPPSRPAPVLHAGCSAT